MNESIQSSSANNEALPSFVRPLKMQSIFGTQKSLSDFLGPNKKKISSVAGGSPIRGGSLHTTISISRTDGKANSRIDGKVNSKVNDRTNNNNSNTITQGNINNLSKSISKVNSQNIQLRKALVMAGGFGTRMKELTKNTPKPMLPLQGKPILEYTIDLCKMHGINEVAVSVFYFGDKIKDYFGSGKNHGINICYVEEKEPLGTAGALRLHRNWLNEPFMMCNADELKDIDLSSMYRQHVQTKADATIALTKVEDPSQYGVVELDGSKILRFVEKPKKEEAPSNLITAGLYIINPEVVSMIPPGFCMMEKHVFPKLAEQGRLFGYHFDGQWFDTGTPERYTTAENLWRGFAGRVSV